MTPGDRLDAAESALDSMDIEPNDLNYAPLHALIAIGRLTMPVALAKRHVGNASGDCCATGATFFWATRKTTLITSVGRSHI